MRLRTVLVRFYKSFNYDYLRKFHEDAKKFEWEKIEEYWYPFVRIPIDPKITTVVGANESGKSHLLSAIEKGITGKEIEREDFCRYSQFFTVQKGLMKWPDFGFEWVDLTPEETKVLRSVCEIPEAIEIQSIFLFRTERSNLKIFVRQGEEFHSYQVTKEKIPSVDDILPRVFHIDPEIALPDSVPIKALADGHYLEGGIDRARRFALVETGHIRSEWFENPQSVTQHASEISTQYTNVLKQSPKEQADVEKKQKEFKLASDLLLKVAEIDRAAFQELYTSLKNGKEGHVNGIIQQINNQLNTNLNFPHWWVQDKDFQLMVSPREFDLVFTVRDKTKTEYSFKERSFGLKYFLSYYTQFRAHAPVDNHQEILLMDEPDAFLSSQAQQDLLKIFEGFADPTDARKPIQVIYVTHSPFLIDKNHSERIRVLEKGVGDEGTRVVNDSAKNHFEPLRSAFGSFVGETAFIGSSNIVVEGSADQILLAGAAVHLRRKKVSMLETLDLNRVTIVPAGSASSVPFIVYLARGRDIEKPPVIVLLDSDKAGTEARKQLQKGGPRRKQLLKVGFVLQIGELEFPNNLKAVEIEDILPPDLCVKAARYYLRNACGADAITIQKIKTDEMESRIAQGERTFDAISSLVSERSMEEFRLDKVGFARSVIDILDGKWVADEIIGSPAQEAVKIFEERMRILFRRLDEMRREAEREWGTERISRKIERIKNAFVQDFPTATSKERVHILFDDLEAALQDDDESEEVRSSLAKIRRDFEIDRNLTDPVSNYPKFKERLESIKYVGLLSIQEGQTEETTPRMMAEAANVSIAPVASKN